MNAEATDPNQAILVLDDEVLIGQMLGELLTGLGYSVSVYDNAVAALEAMGVRRFALVLSDLHMPNMSGRQFYEAAVQARPELAKRVIFITGDSSSNEALSFFDTLGNPLVRKPFHLATLRETITKVLAAVGPLGEDPSPPQAA